ncbi:radical SAM protein [Spirochaetia bacterium]|nr:radical SAM protein [Spirochaetia bacterium]
MDRKRIEIQLEERMKTRMNFQETLHPVFPHKEMLVELVNGCNHKCIFCAQSKMTRKRREIDKNLLLRIMREAHELGVKEIGFYSTSEPFLCKNLAMYVKEAKDTGFEYVYITTNGALATPQRLKEVIDSGADSIKFSINAGTSETYKFIHGYDDFDKVISHLRFCKEYRESANRIFKLYVSYIITRFNVGEIELFKERYSRYCDYISFNPVFNLGGMVPEIYDRISSTPPPGKSFKRPCHNLFDSIGITSEGYLTACGCADFQGYLIVADLNKTSLYDGWYSDKFTGLRKRYLADSLEGLQCFNCVYANKLPYEPLDRDYATIIDMADVFTARHLNNRLNKYPGYTGM